MYPYFSIYKIYLSWNVEFWYTQIMKNYEKKIRKYLEERSWNDLSPADIAKSISIESAELLELF